MQRLIVWMSLIAAALLAGAAAAYPPLSAYTPRKIDGFRVMVNKDVAEADPQLERDVLRILENQLDEVARRVPPPALVWMRRGPIWVELHTNDGAMWTHISRDWLRENGFNPDKVGDVEISNARHFVTWTREQPFMVLHELAHAYQHRVLGDENKEIQALYREALKSGKYEKVLHFDGRTARAYAMTDAREYFAESAEAYFGTNDFYPFVRAELKQFDPKMFAFQERVWNHAPKIGDEPSSPTAAPHLR